MATMITTEAASPLPAGHFKAIRREMLAQLVADAAAVIESDVGAARACLERAAALLQRCQESGATASMRGGVHTGGLAPRQAKRITAYIEANLGSCIRAEHLAAIAGLSMSHFFRAFKETFGAAPLAYVASQRMAHAQQRMLSTRAPLAQIALECGMYDQAHFTRVFRRVVGVNPRAWRRQFTAASPMLSQTSATDFCETL
jgi:AraC-like DNA-binding protein